jgi:hypothetical protein
MLNDSIRGIFRILLIAALLVAGVLQANAQQFDPRQVLATLILELQTGTPNPGLIGPQLWQAIAKQTGNSGVYQPLQQLGQVTGINIVQQIPLPYGAGFVMTAQHQNGQSSWQFAISQMSGKVEYAGFSVQQNGGTGPINPPIGGGGGTTPPPDPNPNPKPISTGDACTKFPDLC